MKVWGIIGIASALSLGSNSGSYARDPNLLAWQQVSASGSAPSGQQTEPEPTQAAGTQRDSLADKTVYHPGSGTVFVVEVPEALDAKKLRAGDSVVCVVRQDLLFKGKIIVPHDAKVIGHVTEAMASTKEHSSRLGLLFEKVVLKDKKELTFQYPAVVEAVAGPIKHSVVSTNRVDQMPLQMEKGKSTGSSAMDAVQSNPNIMGGNFPQTTGVISAANRGVIGLKNLALEKSSPETVTIVAAKGDVKLAPHSQMVLRIIDGAK
jgi:hypothetical protein